MTVRELVEKVSNKTSVIVYGKNANRKFERWGAYLLNEPDSLASLLSLYGESPVVEYDTRKYCVTIYLDD